MTPDIPVTYKYGVVQSFDKDNMSASLSSLGEQVIARLPRRSNLLVLPKQGDIWRFHYTGNAYELDDRLDMSQTDLQATMSNGDVLLHSDNVLTIQSDLLCIKDHNGFLFDPVTGKLNESRLP